MSLALFAILIQLVLMVLAVVVMVYCLPRQVRKELRENYYRSDNSRSRRRAVRERRALGKFAREQFWVMTIVLLPLDVVFLVCNTLVMPAEMALTVITSPQMGERDRDGLQQRHATWYREQFGGTEKDAAKFQRTIWSSSPLLAVLGMAVVGGTAYALYRAYVTGIRRLLDGIRERALEYRLYDQDLWWQQELVNSH